MLASRWAIPFLCGRVVTLCVVIGFSFTAAAAVPVAAAASMEPGDHPTTSPEPTPVASAIPEPPIPSEAALITDELPAVGMLTAVCPSVHDALLLIGANDPEGWDSLSAALVTARSLVRQGPIPKNDRAAATDIAVELKALAGMAGRIAGLPLDGPSAAVDETLGRLDSLSSFTATTSLGSLLLCEVPPGPPTQMTVAQYTLDSGGIHGPTTLPSGWAELTLRNLDESEHAFAVLVLAPDADLSRLGDLAGSGDPTAIVGGQLVATSPLAAGSTVTVSLVLPPGSLAVAALDPSGGIPPDLAAGVEVTAP